MTAYTRKMFAMSERRSSRRGFRSMDEQKPRKEPREQNTASNVNSWFVFERASLRTAFTPQLHRAGARRSNIAPTATAGCIGFKCVLRN